MKKELCKFIPSFAHEHVITSINMSRYLNFERICETCSFVLEIYSGSHGLCSNDICMYSMWDAHIVCGIYTYGMWHRCIVCGCMHGVWHPWHACIVCDMLGEVCLGIKLSNQVRQSKQWPSVKKVLHRLIVHVMQDSYWNFKRSIKGIIT